VSVKVKRQTVEERRAEILQATCGVVIERGFAATRVSDVARELGVSTGLIHYHFDSKEQLLAEAFRFAARQDLDRVAAEIASAATAVAKLDRIFTVWAPEEDDYAWMLWIDAWGEALRNEAMQAISRELDLQSKAQLEAIITEGIESGEFRCSDPNSAAWRLSALADGLAIQMAAHSGIISRSGHRSHLRTAACAELGLAPDAFAQRPRRK